MCCAGRVKSIPAHSAQHLARPVAHCLGLHGGRARCERFVRFHAVNRQYDVESSEYARAWLPPLLVERCVGLRTLGGSHCGVPSWKLVVRSLNDLTQSFRRGCLAKRVRKLSS